MPSRIDIPLSGSAPGNGSAGLDGDVPRNAALAVRMLRYERVPVLDKQTGRPQEGPVMVGGKPLRKAREKASRDAQKQRKSSENTRSRKRAARI